jgi:FkbM family methyltransferase
MRIVRMAVKYIRSLVFGLQKQRRFNFEECEIIIPSRHSLIGIYSESPFANYALKTSGKYFLSKEMNHVIDVGANVGDTAILIKSQSPVEPKFTLVEPSEFYLEYLRLNMNLFSDSEIIDKFVSPNFPIVDLGKDLVHWGGTALLVESKSITIKSSDQVALHELVKVNTGFIKIDCDGQDTDILISFLKNSKLFPTVYFENTIRDKGDLAKSLEILELAKSCGYAFGSIWSHDGLLIWTGELNTNCVADIFRMQLNLQNIQQASRLYYTDVLLVQEKMGEVFSKFEAESRRLQS